MHFFLYLKEKSAKKEANQRAFGSLNREAQRASLYDRQVSRNSFFVPEDTGRFGKLHLYPKVRNSSFHSRADFVNLSVARYVSKFITCIASRAPYEHEREMCEGSGTENSLE